MSASAQDAKNGQPYVLIWSGHRAIADDGLTLVGPFSTHDGAAGWATNPDHNPTDDPCWQTFNLRDPTKVTVLPPGAEAHAAARAIFPERLEPVGHLFGGRPYTLATLVEEQTAALMALDAAGPMADSERSDVIRDALRHFAHLLFGLPEDARGFGV